MAARARRPERDRLLAPGPAEGAGSRVLGRARARGADGGDRRRSPHGAREHSVQSRRDEERSLVRARARGRERPLRRGRVRLCSSRARVDRRRRGAASRVRGSPARARADGARQAPRRRRASVRADLRRREGRGQARRPGEPRRQGGRRARRRQDGGGAARGESAAFRRRPAVGRGRRERVRRGRRHAGRAVRRPAGRLARSRHRPRDTRNVRAAHPSCAHDLLERPDGRFRVAALRRGNGGDRASRRRRGRVLGRRRSRLGPRTAGARPRRPCVLALDRRRRGAGAARREGSPRRGSHSRGLTLLIAANWKMYKGPSETREFLDRFVPPDRVDVVICPAYTSLHAAVESGRTVYAQNVHWAEEGAFTGEVSAAMLVELGVQGSIVGHSERRQNFAETDETTARRAEAALAAGLGVIACVGETEQEREAGETEEVLRRQVGVLPRDDGLVIAYEPVWAIGTGKTATPNVAQEAHAFIRSLHDTEVLYGGSVKPDNAAELLSQPDVDGALVGGASLDVDSLTAICRAAIPS